MMRAMTWEETIDDGGKGEGKGLGEGREGLEMLFNALVRKCVGGVCMQRRASRWVSELEIGGKTGVSNVASEVPRATGTSGPGSRIESLAPHSTCPGGWEGSGGFSHHTPASPPQASNGIPVASEPPACHHRSNLTSPG